MLPVLKVVMKVIKTKKIIIGMPDYYELYVRWHRKAVFNNKNWCLQEANRFARLAEEFGQAVIEEDDTMEDFFDST
jgi:hypothetical protein